MTDHERDMDSSAADSHKTAQAERTYNLITLAWSILMVRVSDCP